MKRLFAWGTALLLVGGMQAASLPVDEPITPVDYVSTLVGTQSKHSLSCLLYTSPSPRDRG